MHFFYRAVNDGGTVRSVGPPLSEEIWGVTAAGLTEGDNNSSGKNKSLSFFLFQSKRQTSLPTKKGISCMWCGTSTQEVVLHLKQTQTPVQMEIVSLCDCCVFLHSGPLKRVLYHVFSTGMEYKQMLYHDFSTGRISYRALHPTLPPGRDPRGHFAMF